jgi:Autophagy-related protein 27
LDPSGEEEPIIDEVYPIAGSFATSTGKLLEPDFERLEDLPESDTKGLRIVLHGGTYNKQSQKAIIDMQCDPERTGNEKSPVKKGKHDEKDEKLRKSEAKDKASDEHDDDDDKNSLRFVSYQIEEEDAKVKTLRLDWRTKYACEKFEDDDEDSGKGSSSSSKHWGFFTWFIVMYVPPIRPHNHSPNSTSETDTKSQSQPLPRHIRLPHLRLLAKLQPLQRTRMGPPPPRRHHPRHTLPVEGLVQKSGQYGPRWGE